MTAQLSPGTVFAQDFRVVRPLAQGGMGAVYVVEQVSTGRPRALKVMHPRLVHDPKNRARFAQEARVGAWIGTEHVVEVVAAGIDAPSGVPWIAMELLEGETLLQRIMREARGRGMPMSEVRAILTQLCQPLVAAHGRGIVHRDLKPENVFLVPKPRHDGPFTVKLLDFGIAKLIDLARPGHNSTEALGTPLWMAPEQNQHGEIGPPADVWAVGLLAFLMLTGRFYWRAANERDLVIAALLGEMLFNPLPTASARARELGCEDRIPPGFDAWFARCVARDPAQRFPSAAEMTRALDWLHALSPAEALAQVAVAPTGQAGHGPRPGAPVGATMFMAEAPVAPRGFTTHGTHAPTLAMESPLVAGAGPGWRADVPVAPPKKRGRGRRVAVVLLLLLGAAGGVLWWLWWDHRLPFELDLSPPPTRARPTQRPQPAAQPLPTVPTMPSVPTVPPVAPAQHPAPPPLELPPVRLPTGVPKADGGA
jgi:tRNA A-37 threonylcarbamoyl transferase component Bud32